MRLLLALLLAGSLHAFEGVVTYKAVNPKGRSHSISYSLKGEKTRVDMATPKGGNIAVIVDNAAKTTLILVEAKKSAIVRPLKEAPASVKGKPVLEKTGRSATIAGYPCEEYRAKGESALVWATTGLGQFRHFEGGPMASRSKVPRWERELGELGLFPLKLTDKGTVLEAQNVDNNSLEDAIFQAPSDYKIIEK